MRLAVQHPEKIISPRNSVFLQAQHVDMLTAEASSDIINRVILQYSGEKRIVLYKTSAARE